MNIMTHYQRGMEKQLDRDWVMLMKKARELGISKREVRNFLHKQRPGY